MQIYKKLFLFITLFAILSVKAQQKKYIIHTIAFYNFENLFDTINGPNNDEEWLKDGAQNWTGKKYKKKLENLSRVLAEIGTGENPNNSPTLIGGCEIENRRVLEDLIKQPKLINKDYGIVHFDSPDKRGIDVALLYQKKHFKPTSFINIPLYIYRNNAAKVTKKEKEEIEEKQEMVEVVAWYSPMIPVSQGPTEYWGLPGLILELSAGNTTMLCSKIVMNPEEKIEIKRPTKGEVVTKKEYNEIITGKMQEMRDNRGRGSGGRSRGL